MNARVIVGQAGKGFSGNARPGAAPEALARPQGTGPRRGRPQTTGRETRAVLAVARGSVARDLRTEIGGGPAAVGLFLRGSPGHGLCRAEAIARVRLGGRVEALRACLQTPSKRRVRARGLHGSAPHCPLRSALLHPKKNYFLVLKERCLTNRGLMPNWGCKG